MSGDTIPCRITGVTVHRHVCYSGHDCAKSLRSSYTGVYPQRGRGRTFRSYPPLVPHALPGGSGPRPQPRCQKSIRPARQQLPKVNSPCTTAVAKSQFALPTAVAKSQFALHDSSCHKSIRPARRQLPKVNLPCTTAPSAPPTPEPWK